MPHDVRPPVEHRAEASPVVWRAMTDWLFALEARRGWDLALERMRVALGRLGHPEKSCPSVLIAGTNGKGSTSALTAAALGHSGLKVGLYTSPHLIDLTERIRIDGRAVPRKVLLDRLAQLRADLDVEGLGLTFFEVTTLAAFAIFAAASVDIAVLEVGLVGRLDANNVADPVVAAITSIGFDHEAYLGSTQAAIAGEKAGVMRTGRPVVLGPGLLAEARAALGARAREIGATVVEASADEGVPPTRLAGRHMRENAATAFAILGVLRETGLDLPATAVVEGFRTVRWPGRFETISEQPTIICDGAHNREGAAALAELLTERAAGTWRLLLSAVADKPWPDVFRKLAPFASTIAVAPTGGRRGVPLADLERVAASLRPSRTFLSAAAALDTLAGDTRDGAPILVAGSLYLVGDAYAWLAERQGVERLDDLRLPGDAP